MLERLGGVFDFFSSVLGLPKTAGLKDLRPSDLGWDGALKEAEDEVHWVVRHYQQEQPDWCWVACIRGARSCFGSEVEDHALVEQLRPEILDKDDQQIKFDELVRVWRRGGFDLAIPHKRPIPEDQLNRSLETEGPVQLILGPVNDPKAQHAILVTGFCTLNGARRYRVSDFLKPVESEYVYSYDDLLQRLEWGAWAETVTGLQYQDTALSRFVCRPGKFLARNRLDPSQPGSGAPPTPMFPGSKHRVEAAPAILNLRREVFIAVSGLRHYLRRRSTNGADFSKSLWIGETLRLVERGADARLDLDRCDEWQRSAWSSVVYEDGRERYYAWSTPRKDDSWYTDWVGMSLARSLASGLRAAASSGEPGQRIELIVPNRWRAILFRLVESEQFLLAGHRGIDRPFRELLSASEMTERLRSSSPEALSEGLTPIADEIWRG